VDGTPPRRSVYLRTSYDTCRPKIMSACCHCSWTTSLTRTLPGGAVRHGKDEVRAAIEAFFVGFPDATFELSSPGSRFACGTRGGVEWTMRGTHRRDVHGMPATGMHVDARGASIVEFADGKMCRCSDYFDRASLLE
jgi:steroid delta-isomerase-like uncharacterized protein